MDMELGLQKLDLFLENNNLTENIINTSCCAPNLKLQIKNFMVKVDLEESNFKIFKYLCYVNSQNTTISFQDIYSYDKI